MIPIEKKRKQVTIPNPYNIGSIDRSIRFIIGGVLMGSIFYLTPTAVWSVAGTELMLMKFLPLISIYPLITAWLGWDPIYELFNTTSETRFKSDVCNGLLQQARAATRI